jgi:hypothetical protein
MNVNRLIIEPFNTWWRQRRGHCEPNPLAVEAFNAGFRAAMELQEIQRKARTLRSTSAGAES